MGVDPVGVVGMQFPSSSTPFAAQQSSPLVKLGELSGTHGGAVAGATLLFGGWHTLLKSIAPVQQSDPSFVVLCFPDTVQDVGAGAVAAGVMLIMDL